VQIFITDAHLPPLVEALGPWLPGLAAAAAAAGGSGGGGGGGVAGGSDLPFLPLFLAHSRLHAPSTTTPPLLCIHSLRVGGVKARLTASLGHSTSSSSATSGGGGFAVRIPPALRWLEILSPNRMPLRTASVSLFRVLSPAPLIRDALLASLLADVLLTSPALLGSFDILGNPTNLVRSVFTGVGEVWRATGMSGGGPAEPAVAESLGVTGRALAVTASLGRFAGHVSGGLLASVAGCAGALSANIDRAMAYTRDSAAEASARELSVGDGGACSSSRGG